MRISHQVKQDIQRHLSTRIRWAAIFSPREILKNKIVSKDIAKEIHSVVSWCMKDEYRKHLQDKTENLLETLKIREIIYVDANQKWESDIFSYMTRLYFNASPESVKIRYNQYMLDDEESDESSYKDDSLFDKKIQTYKNHPNRIEQWSDCMVWVMPLIWLNMLMLLNHQMDLNIYLDNTENVSEIEKKVINNAIRAWLIVATEQWMWLYINNAKGNWDFNIGCGSLPPQDGHDMKVMYL